MFDFNKKILDKGIVFNCQTKQSARILANYLHEYGFKFKYKRNHSFQECWYEYKETTCYFIYKAGNGCRYIQHSNIIYYEYERLEIVNFNIYRAKHIAKQHLECIMSNI